MDSGFSAVGSGKDKGKGTHSSPYAASVFGKGKGQDESGPHGLDSLVMELGSDPSDLHNYGVFLKQISDVACRPGSMSFLLTSRLDSPFMLHFPLWDSDSIDQLITTLNSLPPLQVHGFANHSFQLRVIVEKDMDISLFLAHYFATAAITHVHTQPHVKLSGDSAMLQCMRQANAVPPTCELALEDHGQQPRLLHWCESGVGLGSFLRCSSQPRLALVLMLFIRNLFSRHGISTEFSHGGLHKSVWDYVGGPHTFWRDSLGQLVGGFFGSNCSMFLSFGLRYMTQSSSISRRLCWGVSRRVYQFSSV